MNSIHFWQATLGGTKIRIAQVNISPYHEHNVTPNNWVLPFSTPSLNSWNKWSLSYQWYMIQMAVVLGRNSIQKKTNKSISSAVWTSTQNGNALGSQEISPLRKGPCKPAQANRKVHWVKSNPTLQKPSKWTTLITKPRKCVDMQKTLIGLMCNSVSGRIWWNSNWTWRS